MKTREDLESIAKNIRKDILKMAHNSGEKGAHLGGGMSCSDILAVLYSEILSIRSPSDEDFKYRDRFILSKAHCAIALYAALHSRNILSDDEIGNAFIPGSPFYKHPYLNLEKGIEFSGGSLGQGVSLAVGSALALRLDSNDSKFYVLVGDGECDEGSIWESLSSIIHFNLTNVITIIDRNKLQNDGTTDAVMGLGDLKGRLGSMGFKVSEIDGHDVIAIREALTEKIEKPLVVIANTVKGKGVSFAENCVDWHLNYLTDELYSQALKELDNVGDQ